MTERRTAEGTAAPSAATTRRVSRLWPLVISVVALLLTAAGGLLLAARRAAPGIDTEWMGEMLEHRNLLGEVPALVMNFLGGGWFAVVVVPILVIGALCLVRRFRAAIFFGSATAASAIAVQVLKQLLGRARPLDKLVQIDTGSFPSGHVANAATMAAVLCIVFWRTWVWLAGAAYVLLMMLSRTYLGVHWLTDTLGGLVLGVAIAVMVWAPLADGLRREARGRRTQPSRLC
jgi:membrane-associated phospholipid phosphatase